MEPRDTEHFERFEAALAAWTDERFVTREQIKALSMFSLYLVNLLDPLGIRYRGHSYKESEYMSLLVVRAVVREVPSVVFVNARTYVGCVTVFLRQLGEGSLEWRKDRYG